MNFLHLLRNPETPLLRYLVAPVHFAMLFLAGLYLVFLNPVLDLTEFNANDPAAYLGRAVSLLEGTGYGERYADAFLPVTLQPPGLSVLLAPAIKFFGINFVILKLIMVFFALLCASRAFFFFQNFLPASCAASALTLLLMAHPAVFGLSHRVLAEIPLMAAVLGGIVFLDRYLKKSGGWFAKDCWLACGMIAAGYFFKETALAVWIGGGILFLHPRFFKRELFLKLLIVGILVGVPVFLWQQYCKQVPQSGFWAQSSGLINFTLKNPYELGDSAVMGFSDLLVRVRRNIAWGMAANIGMLAVPPFYFLQGSMMSFLLSLPVLAWFGFQMLRSWIKTPSVMEGFAVISLLVLLPKIEGMALRYVVPLYPVFLIYAARGFWDPAKNHFKKSGIFIFSAVLFLSAVSTVASAVRQAENPYGTRLAADYVKAGEAMKEKLPAKSLCAAPLPSHWQVLTGHLSYLKPSVSREGAAYAVFLTEEALARDENQNLKDFPATLFKEGKKFREDFSPDLTDSGLLYKNDSFEVHSLGGGAS